MRVASGRRGEGVVIDFEETSLVQKPHQAHSDSTDMKHFLNDIETLNLPEVKNQPEI